MSKSGLTVEQLAEIKRLDSERTPGIREYNEGPDLILREINGGAVEVYSDPDARFVVAAFWAIPALVAEVERLRAENKEYLEEIQRYRFRDQSHLPG